MRLSTDPKGYRRTWSDKGLKWWLQTGILTFLWNVPSSAATMTVLPELAISSQNSTRSGNWCQWRQMWTAWTCHDPHFIRLTNCPSSIPMTPNSAAFLLTELSSVAAVADVTCLQITGGKTKLLIVILQGEGIAWLVMSSHTVAVISVVLGIFDHEAGVIGYLVAPHPTDQLRTEERGDSVYRAVCMYESGSRFPWEHGSHDQL